MNNDSTQEVPQVLNIPVYTEGGKPPPFCIQDATRGTTMLLSSPSGPLSGSFLSRILMKPGQTRGRVYIDSKLKNGTKFIFLTEGTATLLLSTHIENKKVISARTLEMKAPCMYAVPTGEACVLIPTSTGEFIETAAVPHQSLTENSIAVDFGEHLSSTLKKLGF